MLAPTLAAPDMAWATEIGALSGPHTSLSLGWPLPTRLPGKADTSLSPRAEDRGGVSNRPGSQLLPRELRTTTTVPTAPSAHSEDSSRRALCSVTVQLAPSLTRTQRAYPKTNPKLKMKDLNATQACLVPGLTLGAGTAGVRETGVPCPPPTRQVPTGLFSRVTREGAVGVQAREAAEGPDRKDVPIARVADGTGLVEDARDVLLRGHGALNTKLY